jgi:3-carboxy-cis,cis-muconate cycloisomerase
MPWHAQRDAVAEFASWLSLVSGSLGKMAQDVILLAQTEVDEVAESGDAGRGGSSTMPQKRNPMVSAQIVAAARFNAALLAAVHQALVHEHERATHGWQLEWLTLPQMVAAAAGALTNAERLVGDLVVNPERMRANIEGSKGAVLAEALSYALSAVMPRADAHSRVRDAALTAAKDGRDLVDAVREAVAADIPADAIDWDRLADPSNYLGETEKIIDRIVARARRAGCAER